MGDTLVTPVERRRRKCHVLADEIGLGREDRRELAELILHRDITSWRDLTPEDYDRILDALNGYQAIRHLLMEQVSSR